MRHKPVELVDTSVPIRPCRSQPMPKIRRSIGHTLHFSALRIIANLLRANISWYLLKLAPAPEGTEWSIPRRCLQSVVLCPDACTLSIGSSPCIMSRSALPRAQLTLTEERGVHCIQRTSGQLDECREKPNSSLTTAVLSQRGQFVDQDTSPRKWRPPLCEH